MPPSSSQQKSSIADLNKNGDASAPSPSSSQRPPPAPPQALPSKPVVDTVWKVPMGLKDQMLVTCIPFYF